jgi:hypothetical protein
MSKNSRSQIVSTELFTSKDPLHKYVLGYLYGCSSLQRSALVVSLSEHDLDFVDIFNEATGGNIRGVANTKTVNGKNYTAYRLNISCKKFYQAADAYGVGKNMSATFHIPSVDVDTNGNEDISLAMIRGFFEASGHLYFKRTAKRVELEFTIGSRSVLPLMQIQAIINRRILKAVDSFDCVKYERVVNGIPIDARLKYTGSTADDVLMALYSNEVLPLKLSIRRKAIVATLYKQFLDEIEVNPIAEREIAQHWKARVGLKDGLRGKRPCLFTSILNERYVNADKTQVH